MSTLYVKTFRPLGKSYDTLADAVKVAHDGDLIHIGRAIAVDDDLVVDRNVTIEGAKEGRPTTVSVSSHHAILAAHTLHLRDLVIEAGPQANVLRQGKGASLTLERVTLRYDRAALNTRTRPEERYPLLLAEDGDNTLDMDRCDVQGTIIVKAEHIRLENTRIGALGMPACATSAHAVLQGDKVRADQCSLSRVMLISRTLRLNTIRTLGDLTLIGAGTLTGLIEAENDPGRKRRKGTQPDKTLTLLTVTVPGPEPMTLENVELGATLKDHAPADLTVNGTLNLTHCAISKTGRPGRLRGSGTLKLESVRDLNDWTVLTPAPTVAAMHSHGRLARMQAEANKARREDSDALACINAMVGLQAAKAQLNSLIATARVNEARRAAGMKTTEMNLNMVFLGPAGCGKTTVARKMGRALYDIGSIEKNLFVEKKIGALKGTHVGEAARNMDMACEQAMGGMLFLDEAYQLGADDVYTPELVTELLKYTDDTYRGKLVVVLAGYTTELTHVLQHANPGLNRRFPTRIEFTPYSGAELYTITTGMLAADSLILEHGADAALRDWMVAVVPDLAADPTFGNAGWARTRADRLTAIHNQRLAAERRFDKTSLTTITGADVAAFITEKQQ